MRAGEQRIAGLVEDLDRALGRQRIGPHQHRLIRFPREVLEFRQIGFKEGRATRRDHDNDAVDYRAIFAHYGLTEGRDFDEMLDLAAGYLPCGDRLPAGNRVGICTASGAVPASGWLTLAPRWGSMCRCW